MGTCARDTMSQSSSNAADADDAAPLTFDALPLALALRVFSLLPVDARLRAAAVCRSWRAMLAERSLWTRLDLTQASGVRRPKLFLRAAAARAGGQLEVLCAPVSWSDRPWLHAELMCVLSANATTMQELFLGTAYWLVNRLAEVLRAAPGLRRLEAGVACGAADVLRVLRREPPFGALRVTGLHLLRIPDDDVQAVADSLAAHTSLEHVTVYSRWPEAQADSDALAGALASLPRLCLLHLSRPPAAVLARLLGCPTLKKLRVDGLRAPLLDSPASAALLGNALRAATQLDTLNLDHVDFWHNLEAATALLAALQAHPSLANLQLPKSLILLPERAAAAGTAIGALVSASPSLRLLDIESCHLGDAGLGPIMDALPHARHLHTLRCHDN